MTRVEIEARAPAARPEPSELPSSGARGDEPHDYCLYGFQDPYMDGIVRYLTDRGVTYASIVIAVRRTLETMADSCGEALDADQEALAEGRRRARRAASRFGAATGPERD